MYIYITVVKISFIFRPHQYNFSEIQWKKVQVAKQLNKKIIIFCSQKF